MLDSLIKPLLKDIKTFVLDTLFPIYCLRCGTEGVFICPSCLLELKRLDKQYCIVCEKPSIGGITHPGCMTPYCADGLISILNYHDDDVANIIIKGKYSFLPSVYENLGKLMAEELATNYPLQTTHLFIPIPLAPSRKRWRGFNQAEILCQTLSQTLGSATTSVLVRCKTTKTQKDLKKEQRIKNVSEAFKLATDADVHGLNLILVDDVTTTGSTLLEAAKVLKRNGAAKVWCLTVARD